LEPAVKRGEFVVEGLIELGPRADFFLFVDGEHFGKLLVEHAGIESAVDEYTPLGKARITVEWLEDDEATEVASPT
jgi:hypothetical protein